MTRFQLTIVGPWNLSSTFLGRPIQEALLCRVVGYLGRPIQEALLFRVGSQGRPIQEALPCRVGCQGRPIQEALPCSCSSREIPRRKIHNFQQIFKISKLKLEQISCSSISILQSFLWHHSFVVKNAKMSNNLQFEGEGRVQNILVAMFGVGTWGWPLLPATVTPRHWGLPLLGSWNNVETKYF